VSAAALAAAGAAALSGAGAAAALATGTPALAAGTSSLTIAVDNQTKQARAGSTLVYRVTVRNVDTARRTRADLRLSLPTGGALVEADGGGTPGQRAVTWVVDVPAGGSVTVTAKTRIGDVPPDTKGLAATACVLRKKEALPVVCASDVDQIPGALSIHATSEPHAAAVRSDAGARSPRQDTLAASIVAAGLAAAAVAGFYLWLYLKKA
jgi:hypothetical protein